MAAPVVQSPPLQTSRTGSSLVAFAGGYAANAALPTDTYNNRWSLLEPAITYRGYDGRFDMRAYRASNAKGGPDHRIGADKPGVPAGESTLAVVEVRNAVLVDAAWAYPPPGSRIVSGEVTTRGPATLVAAWWGDGRGLRHFAEPGAGFDVIGRFTRLPPNSAVQAVVAVREVSAAGAYRVAWYQSPRQGAILWLLAFAPADVGSAADRQPPQQGIGQHVE